MIYWYSHAEMIEEELKLLNKKKQVLDNSFREGISQSAYDFLNKKFSESIDKVEARQKLIVEKMGSKINELEQQKETLEMLIENVKIDHAVGEIDEELYESEIEALDLKLENVNKELEDIKEAIYRLMPEEADEDSQESEEK